MGLAICEERGETIMQKRIDFISFEEFQKLYKAEKDKSMKLAMLLMFGSGLRISEVIGLEKEMSACCRADVLKEKVNQ